VMWVGRRVVSIHRLVMSILLGRPLGRNEHVHHIDGNKCNNHPANLQLLSAYAHNVMSAQRYPLVGFCALCGRPYLTGGNPPHPERCCGRSCACKLRWRKTRLGQRCIGPLRASGVGGGAAA